MSLIHPTALVDPAAELDSSVAVGPYTVIGPNVKVGAGTYSKFDLTGKAVSVVSLAGAAQTIVDGNGTFREDWLALYLFRRPSRRLA